MSAIWTEFWIENLQNFNIALRTASRDPKAKWALFGQVLIFCSTIVITLAIAVYIPWHVFHKQAAPKKKVIRDFSETPRKKRHKQQITTETCGSINENGMIISSPASEYTYAMDDHSSHSSDSNEDGHKKKDRYEGARNSTTGFREGYGIMHYKNGTVYDGEWLANKQHGQGTATSINGDTYTGNWSHGKRHEQGEMQYSDGSVFIGTFVHGKKHGFGVLSFPNMDVIQGHWENGEVVKGTASSNGNVYTGQLQNNTPHGNGVMIFRPLSDTGAGADAEVVLRTREVSDPLGLYSNSPNGSDSDNDLAADAVAILM